MCRSFYFFTLRDVVGAIPYKTDSRGRLSLQIGRKYPSPTFFTSSLFTLHYSLFTIHSAGCRGRHPLQKRTVEDACPYKLGGNTPPLHFTSSLFTLHYSLCGMSWALIPTETDSRGCLSLQIGRGRLSLQEEKKSHIFRGSFYVNFLLLVMMRR